MLLEGAVTNVTNFGAFIDIGVHQDGLIHISALANKFIKDPHEVVKTGDIVTVKVVEVDNDRKRIALSMRTDDEVSSKSQDRSSRAAETGKKRSPQTKQAATKVTKQPVKGSMAALFEQALNKKP